MAGHSKWANIQHRKGAQDAKRGVLFQKLSKEIYVAATKGTDPSMNPALRLAVSKAKAQSMPKSNIEKAISKAAGVGGNGSGYTEYLYSGTLSGGATILISCLTDNFNRLSSILKAYFNKQNGQMGKAGAIPYVFDQKGLIIFDVKNYTEDEITLVAIENGAEDIEFEENMVTITSAPSDLSQLSEALEKEFNIEKFERSEVTYLPNSKVELDEEKTQKILNSIDALEEEEDIQEVYHNLEI
ncbi:YebC/PmpR family DNA-binding transcriptional regulator [Mycoplasma sp. M5725]|uniref:Probable transcriptional regulatory protein QLQ80_00270 n=1 Tax=Mycoplasma phocimorsus TaxID=3045839 RepID=A0AAJ1PQL4_9MOLU|nr:YebC/PmpR family DNA-binding transcriptional regulator [Mycoplasma phocimorsus]MDJ1645527.1 YebC/PmpR family DNA-binding transcriptional regulator [Mycoplasma phocimorsus]